jgi:hypothetical protein
MLQPNAKKSIDQNELAEMVAEFKQRGGVIQKLETGVSGGVVKSRYVRRGRPKATTPAAV